MSLQFSDAVRNALLDAMEAAMGTMPRFCIYTGAQPANCAAAATGTLLVYIACPSDYMDAASGGAKAMLGSWTVAATAAGIAGHYRMYDSAGTTCHEQGTVTATGGGGDVTLDNVVIAAGQTVTVTAKTQTAPGV